LLLLLLLLFELKLVLAAAGNLQAGLRGLIAASNDHTSTTCDSAVKLPVDCLSLQMLLQSPAAASAAAVVVGDSQPSLLVLLGLLLALAMMAPPLTLGSTSVNFTSSHTSL
jgi:hypothetical protein